MSRTREHLRLVVESVKIRDATCFRIKGHEYAYPWPHTRLARAGHGDPLSTQIDALASAIYSELYMSRRGAGRLSPSSLDLVAKASAANKGVGALEYGWLIDASGTRAIVTKHGIKYSVSQDGADPVWWTEKNGSKLPESPPIWQPESDTRKSSSVRQCGSC